MVFSKYARYYDLLNQDKDYDRESEYVYNFLRKYNPSLVNVLDMGCGTGTHALGLAQQGCNVVGIDRSEEQLQRAKEKFDQESNLKRQAEFNCGDIRSLELGRTFDAAISLFHVMSYQTENADLHAAFMSARKHLNTGGLFLFDVWYGPAVLTLVPECRIKRVNTDTSTLVRIAEPEMKVNKNRVDVNYELLVFDRAGHTLKTIRETHPMRYFFLPEIAYFLERNGFRLLLSEEWLTGNQPSSSTWSCCFLAEAVTENNNPTGHDETHR